jgi:peptidoglycan/xylan/chitin deacetylase (PgdA/CDA1 family)
MKRSVLVLTYHHVNDHEGALVTVSPRIFEQQIAALAERGYTFLTADDFAAIIRGGREAPRRPVLITFDDGYLDTWLHAYPVLKRFGARACLFLVTSWVADRSDRREPGVFIPDHEDTTAALTRHGAEAECALTWGEVEAMARDGVMDVQSHTQTHLRCRVSENSAEAIARELAGSREIIESRLGKSCRHLAWPKGKYDAEAIRLARSLGYEALFTTLRGANPVPGDLSEIKRLEVKPKHPAWLLSRMGIYARPLVGGLYSRMRGE